MPTIWGRPSLQGLGLLVTWGGDDSEVYRMNSHGDPGLTSAVFLGGIVPQIGEVGISLGTGEQIGDGAAGFVNITVST